jgi:hypothetical protein
LRESSQRHCLSLNRNEPVAMKLHRKLSLEFLEGRALLATIGELWPEPGKLTLSFAPEGTQIGIFPNELFSTLGRERAAAVWQADVLRAFQSWAAVANVDFGLARDSGRPFGAAGLAQSDPRFGDIRIGAFPQARVIANTVPYRAVAGSWSGDVFLNSSLAAGLHSAAIDLYSVVLHEAGNALGLADTQDPGSAMFTEYRGPRDGLAPQDIATIQSLYGVRMPDANEAAFNNDSAEAATLLASGSSTWSFEADVHHSGDVDYVRIPAMREGGRISVRLVAAGKSLFVGAVEVLRADGASIASSAAVSPLANNIDLTAGMPPSTGDLFVRVSAKEQDVFGVGRYRLEINVRGGDSAGPSAASPAPESQVPSVGLSPLTGLLDEEFGQNDAFATATFLEASYGYVTQSHFEAIGAIYSLADVDIYRITAPAYGDRRLTVYLDTFAVRLLDFKVGLYDASGTVIAEQLVVQADGRIVIDVPEVDAGETYYLHVSAGGAGASALGNYLLVADFLREDSREVPLGSGVLSSAAQRDVQLWHAPRTILYRFQLKVDETASDAAVRFEIRDSRGELVNSSSALPGTTTADYAWLPAGSFEFVIQAEKAPSEEFPPITYSLSTVPLSDDVGPGLVDPTENLLPGDANRSGIVDRADIAVSAKDYGDFADAIPSRADFDRDGDVDLADLLTIAANFGRALLPDLSVSTSGTSTSTNTSSGSGSGTETAAAPSSIVHLKSPAATVEYGTQFASQSTRYRRSGHCLAMDGGTDRTVRRLSASPVDALLGDEAQATRLSAGRSATPARSRSGQ